MTAKDRADGRGDVALRSKRTCRARPSFTGSPWSSSSTDDRVPSERGDRLERPDPLRGRHEMKGGGQDTPKPWLNRSVARSSSARGRVMTGHVDPRAPGPTRSRISRDDGGSRSAAMIVTDVPSALAVPSAAGHRRVRVPGEHDASHPSARPAPRAVEAVGLGSKAATRRWGGEPPPADLNGSMSRSFQPRSRHRAGRRFSAEVLCQQRVRGTVHVVGREHLT